jgi:alpha-beta hydrolase superfamily lysophospholipase
VSAWQQYGYGRVSASENDIIIRPKDYTDAKRGILYCHGYEASGVSTQGIEWQKNAERALLIGSLASAGYIVLSCDLGGANTWGNSTHISRIGTAATYLLGLGVLPTKIALVATSMGALGALAWAAANPTLASCIAGLLPCLDLTDIHTNNRGGYASVINTSYGGTYSEASFGAAHNPQTMAAAGSYATLPVKVWYGDSDAIATPTAATTFASTVGGSCAPVPLAGGHAEATYGLVSIAELVAFIKSAG